MKAQSRSQAAVRPYMKIVSRELQAWREECLAVDNANMLVVVRLMRKVEERGRTDVASARRLAKFLTEHITSLRLARIARGAGCNREHSA